MSGDAAGDVQRVWSNIAGWWDDYIGPEGNLFHRLLVAPAQMRLLVLRPGERVLDIACGNGQFAREMARAGARVLATDFAEPFLDRARQHTAGAGLDVDYRTADATDEAQLLALGAPGSFDAVVCTMAIHDIADIEPMLRAARVLLPPDGRFVFSLIHPCFNSPGVVMMSEFDDRDGAARTNYSIKVAAYLEQKPSRGTGVIGQPEPHWYFHRPLHELLGACFGAGFVLDALEEPAFAAGAGEPERPFSWRNYPQIPPILVARLRPR